MAKDNLTDTDLSGNKKARSLNIAKWAAIITVLAAVLAVAWFLYHQAMNKQQKPYSDITPPAQSAVTAAAAPQPVISPGPMLCWINFNAKKENNVWRAKARAEANKACPGGRSHFVRFQECVIETVPQDVWTHSWSIPLYSGPSGTGTQVGEIRVTASMFNDFSMQFIARDGTAVSFEVDDPTGYPETMSYLHTVLDRQGDWALLPKDPFPTEVWFNAAGYFFVYLIGSEVYEWNGKDIVFMDMQEEGISVRDTVSSDYPSCGEEAKETPEEQFNKFTIPWSDLFDENRHLRLKQTYMIC